MDPSWGPEYAHLPRTCAYVASLPRGLASYPECRTKASVWKNIRRLTDTSKLVGRVPPELTVLSAEGLLDTTWISSAESFASHLALRDVLFPSDEAIVEHFRTVDRQLLSGPLYRMLFAVATPQRILHAADRRFRSMFEGITLTAHQEDATRVSISLKYPARVLPPLVGTLYLVAFEVAAELAGGKAVKSRVISHGDTAAKYELTWAGG